MVYKVGGGRVALWENEPYAYSLYADEELDDDAILNAACGRARWTFIKNMFSAADEMLTIAENGFSELGFTFMLDDNEYDRLSYHIIDGHIAQTVFWEQGGYYIFRIAAGEQDISGVDAVFTETAGSPLVDGKYFSGLINIQYTPREAGLGVWNDGGYSYSLYAQRCDVERMQQTAFDIASEAGRQLKNVK